MVAVVSVVVVACHRRSCGHNNIYSHVALALVVAVARVLVGWLASSGVAVGLQMNNKLIILFLLLLLLQCAALKACSSAFVVFAISCFLTSVVCYLSTHA